MLGARRRTAALAGLHGETAEYQLLRERLYCRYFSVVDRFRSRERITQPVLHEMPGKLVQILTAHRIGDNPVSPCRNLRKKVGIPGNRKIFRSLRSHRRIHNDSISGTAVECPLEPVLYDGSAVSRKTVHRDGCSHNHISSSQMFRDKFRQIIHHSGTDGDGNGVALSQGSLKLLHE